MQHSDSGSTFVNAGTYTTDKWLEGGGATITPLSGSPYVVSAVFSHSSCDASAIETLRGLTVSSWLFQVWPVIHSKLVKRGLKSIPAEEVSYQALSTASFPSMYVQQWQTYFYLGQVGTELVAEGTLISLMGMKPG